MAQAGLGLDDDGARFAAAQCKGGIAEPDRHRIAARPDLLDDFEGLARDEAEFEQAPAHGGLRLVAEALGVVAHVDDHTPGAFAERGKTDGRHSAVGHG